MNRLVLYSNKLFQLVLFLSSRFGIFMKLSKQLMFEAIADSATGDLSAPLALSINIYRENICIDIGTFACLKRLSGTLFYVERYFGNSRTRNIVQLNHVIVTRIPWSEFLNQNLFLIAAFIRYH